MGRDAYGRRPLVEESVRLDADEVAFAHERGRWVGFNLTYSGWDEETVYSYFGRFDESDGICLELCRTRTIGDSEPVNMGTQFLGLRSTPCRFGGRRWWFLCPRCLKDRKALWFHLWDGAFACRECLRMKYRSQCENYRWDRGFGIMPGLRYTIMRECREETMWERKVKFYNDRQKRRKHRRNPAPPPKMLIGLPADFNG